MNELQEAVKTRTHLLTEPDFRKVAIKWADFVLRNQRDELLHRGLALAEALALYQDEFDACLGTDAGAAR